MKQNKLTHCSPKNLLLNGFPLAVLDSFLANPVFDFCLQVFVRLHLIHCERGSIERICLVT